MLSPGGKVEWTCPHCGSGDIERVLWQWFPRGQQKSGLCNACCTWWPWRWRIKRSAQQ